MWKYTNLCEYPHVEKRISPCADLHIFLCISTCGNSLKTVQIRVSGNTLFLVKEFTLNCVSPHAVIHQKLCISTQRIYAFLGAFPQVEIHNCKCKSPYAENQSLLNFLRFWEIHLFSCISAWDFSSWGNSHGTVYLRMQEFTELCESPHSGITHFRVHFHKWKFTIIRVYPHMRKLTF